MKTKSFLVFLLATSLVFTGCSWKKTKDSEESVTATGTPVEENSVIDMDSDSVSLSSVTYSGASLTGSQAFDSAVNAGDEKACKKLSSEEDRTICSDKILYASAISELRIDLCEEISDAETKKLCISDVSEQTLARVSDLAGCKRIKNSALRTQCEERMKVLENPKNEAACATLQDSELRTQCVDRVLINSVRAGTVTDPKFCDKIKDPLLVRECRFRVAQTRESEAKKQSYASGEYGEIKSACASETGANADYCRKEKALEIIAKTGDSGACSVIENSAMRESCTKDAQAKSAKAFFDQAMAAKDASICEKITDAPYAARCKEIVAKNP